MNRRRHPLLISLLAVAGVTLTSCGSASTLSAADLRTKADEICGRVQSDIGALPTPSSNDDAATAVDKALTISRKGIAELRALKAAKADDATMAKLTGLLDDANVQLVKAGDAFRAGDDAAATAASDAYQAKIAEFADTAKATGFTGCAKKPEAATTPTTEAPAPEAAATEPPTTAAPATEPPTTVAASSDPAVGAASGDVSDSPFEFVNLGDRLTPIPGYELSALPSDANTALIKELSANPDVVRLSSAIGTGVVTKEGKQALLIFVGLKRELDATELDEFVKGVIGDGTNVERGDVAGRPGWAYTTTDGQQAFTTVRATTAVLALADDQDHLAGVIAGLFQANPQL